MLPESPSFISQPSVISIFLTGLVLSFLIGRGCRMLAHIKLQLKSRGILKKACDTLDFFMFTAFFLCCRCTKN